MTSISARAPALFSGSWHPGLGAVVEVRTTGATIEVFKAALPVARFDLAPHSSPDVVAGVAASVLRLLTVVR